MQLDLLENAIGSIVHGLEHYAEGNRDSTNYKFAILHLAQGVELVLKERLSREHRVLVFEKVEKPEGRTVDFDTCVQRLGSICGVTIADMHLRKLQDLKKNRNEIEHYRVTLSQKQAVAIIGGVVPFLVDFLDRELGVSLQERLDEGTWQELLSIEGLYSSAKDKADEVLSSLRWDEREGAHHPVWSCPTCGEEYMVECDQDRESGQRRAKCLLCSHLSVLRECLRCGEAYPDDDWGAEHGLCEACVDYVRQPYT